MCIRDRYNTFRQAQNIPMSTTFCTNHVRQVGIAFSEAVRHKGKDQFQRMFFHLRMLAVFVLAAVISTVLCHYFLGKAIFAALIPLAIVFADFLYADLKKEKGDLNRVPRGH